MFAQLQGKSKVGVLDRPVLSVPGDHFFIQMLLEKRLARIFVPLVVTLILEELIFISFYRRKNTDPERWFPTGYLAG